MEVDEIYRSRDDFRFGGSGRLNGDRRIHLDVGNSDVRCNLRIPIFAIRLPCGSF
jgi:hypothetical protein